MLDWSCSRVLLISGKRLSKVSQPSFGRRIYHSLRLLSPSQKSGARRCSKLGIIGLFRRHLPFGRATGYSKDLVGSLERVSSRANTTLAMSSSHQSGQEPGRPPFVNNPLLPSPAWFQPPQPGFFSPNQSFPTPTETYNPQPLPLSNPISIISPDPMNPLPPKPSEDGDDEPPSESAGAGSSQPSSSTRQKAKPKKMKIKRKLKTQAPPSSTKLPSTAPALTAGASRDPISPPSVASGGIPEPTPAYLLRASFLAQDVLVPRPILVVIDLNGTLLHRPSSRRAPSHFVERPHAQRFLTYCIDTFHVVIWSSARPDNVRKMCAQLLSPSQLQRVVAVWGRDRFGLCAEDYIRRTQCYKRLTILWEDPVVAASHPTGAPWNQGNTVLIDDSAEKARSEPFNAITLPEFVGNTKEKPEVLPIVHDYLNLLAVQSDVSTFIRTHPFQADTAVVAGYQSPPET